MLERRMQTYIGCEFMVIGKVTGVYFRSHAKAMADRLGLVGWVANNSDGCIVGEVQGPRDEMCEMMDWLKTKVLEARQRELQHQVMTSAALMDMQGSPGSVIKKCKMDENWYLPQLNYQEFAMLEEPMVKDARCGRGQAMKRMVPAREVRATITYLQPPPSREVHQGLDVTPEEVLMEIKQKPGQDVHRVPTTYLKPRPGAPQPGKFSSPPQRRTTSSQDDDGNRIAQNE